MLLQAQDTGSRGPWPASPRPRSHIREAASSDAVLPRRHCYLPAAPRLPALPSAGHTGNGKSQDSTNSNRLAEKGDSQRETGTAPAQGRSVCSSNSITSCHGRAGCTGYHKPKTSQSLSLDVCGCKCLCKAQQGHGPGSSRVTQCSSWPAPSSTHSTGLMGRATAKPKNVLSTADPSGSLQALHPHTKHLLHHTVKASQRYINLITIFLWPRIRVGFPCLKQRGHLCQPQLAERTSEETAAVACRSNRAQSFQDQEGATWRRHPTKPSSTLSTR